MQTTPDSSAESIAKTDRQLTWLTRAIGLFGLLMIASTWRLWTPQDVFPQVPLIRTAGEIPSWLEWPLLAVMIGALTLLLVGPKSSWKRAAMTFVAAMAIMIAVDQHRLQPWAYQLMILCLTSLLSPPAKAIALARWLLISIYLFSAVSKFDYQFCHTLGQQFLETWLGFVHVSMNTWSDSMRATAAAIFPIGEFGIAAGLMIPRSRQFAAGLGIGLHAALVLILGPFGLNHFLGVLLWNLFFIVQLAILFLLPTSPKAAGATTLGKGYVERFAVLLALCCIFAPLTEPFGLIDHWPAWQLYAPRNSRVTMQVFESAADKLPADVRRHVKSIRDDGPLVEIDLAGWSLESLSTPIYPQDRFQLGVAAAVARDFELGGAVIVTRQSVAERLTGRRRETILRGTDRIEEELTRFRFNACPR